MLLPCGLSAYSFTVNNWTANPGTTQGTDVTPGTSDAEGAWTEVLAAASVTKHCYWMHLAFSGGRVAGQIENQLVDVGVDPAGGTAYSAIISNFQVGSAPNTTDGGKREHVFPFFIPSGSSVAVRMQGSNAVAEPTRAIIALWGQPSRPENVPVGMFSETLGTLSGSKGQSFTPGNAADGTYADFGTTTQNLWWWQVGVGVDNATMAQEKTFVDVAWGDATNKHVLFRTTMQLHTTEHVGFYVPTYLAVCAAYQPVPAGSHIYVRGRCDSAPDTGYHATVIGIGG